MDRAVQKRMGASSAATLQSPLALANPRARAADLEVWHAEAAAKAYADHAARVKSRRAALDAPRPGTKK